MPNCPIFYLGCGKFFEGTAAEMHEALNKRLAALPDDTIVFVGLHPKVSLPM